MASGICLFITWLFILAGAVEAVWGLAQVYGFTASKHSLYALLPVLSTIRDLTPVSLP